MTPERGYSAIEHLARISCSFLSDWRKVLMGMTAAFDASGDESSQLILVVAGFISSANDWATFSDSWVSRLYKDGLSYMHMKEFAHSTGEFSHGWKGNEARRQRLLRDLMEIIRSNVYRKFGTVVVNERFRNSLSAQTLDEWHLNAYSLAGRSCAKQVNEWAAEGRCERAIELIFEKGDVGSSKLHRRLVEDGYQAPVFKPKKDEYTPEGIRNPAFVPLQAADWLAYELFLGVTRMLENSDRSLRWGLNEFQEMPGYIGSYEVKDLEGFQQMVNITKEVDAWAVSLGLLKVNDQGKLYKEIRVPICALALFTWARIRSDSGNPIIEPVCLIHRDGRIEVEQRDNDVSVTCKPANSTHHHLLGSCKLDVFMGEQSKAREHLESQGVK